MKPLHVPEGLSSLTYPPSSAGEELLCSRPKRRGVGRGSNLGGLGGGSTVSGYRGITGVVASANGEGSGLQGSPRLLTGSGHEYQGLSLDPMEPLPPGTMMSGEPSLSSTHGVLRPRAPPVCMVHRTPGGRRGPQTQQMGFPSKPGGGN